MGGLTYLVGGLVNAVLAVLIAVPLALLSVAVPVNEGAAPRWRAKRAILVGVLGWLLLVGIGCASMFMRHDDSRDAGQELASIGLAHYGLKPLRATTVTHGDTAQTYILAEADRATFETLAADMSELERVPFDAHTLAERGWPVPAWWPERNCEDGFELRDNPFDDATAAAPPPVDFTLNWCPATSRLYIQRFDY